jgi:CPA1 family monovalent cation:H+ antiporter
MIWVFAGAYIFKTFNRDEKQRNAVPPDKDRYSDWKNVLIVAWTGTRGVITMALALALPLTLYNGNAFPQRHQIVFVCFVVVFITLVVQGFSLPLLIRLLGVKPSGSGDKEEKELQLYIVNSTLHFIDHEFYPQPEEFVRKELKKKFGQVAARLVREIDIHTKNESEEEQLAVRTLTDMQKAQIQIGQFQRELLLKLHKEGRFSDTAIRKVERDMDIDELKLNQLLPKEEK